MKSGDVASVVRAIAALAEAVRELKEVPSGHLYARVMGAMTLGSYEAAVRVLKDAGLVEERGHVLRWVGPEIPETEADESDRAAMRAMLGVGEPDAAPMTGDSPEDRLRMQDHMSGDYEG